MDVSQAGKNQDSNTDGRPFFGSSCDLIMGHRVLANDHTVKSSGKSWQIMLQLEMEDKTQDGS